MPGIIGALLNGRYRLDFELGQGGMGTVYCAHDTLLKRDVAVKVLSRADLSTQRRARLLREAQAVAQLNHPNVASVYDAGEAELPGSVGTVPFIVMELVKGDSLHDCPPGSLDEILAIACQVCTALEHAHAEGIIHRDLKPENVLVLPDGSAKLVDFGLARTVDSRLTAEGSVLGTVSYIAPEQALGQEIDGRADLYTLGVMLYEWTTGRLPFTGDDPLALIGQHLHASVVPPREHNPEIPPALDSLIVQLMSKQADDRPASAQEVRHALGALGEAAFPVQPSRPRVRMPGFLQEGAGDEGVQRPTFVARERELARLDGFLAQALTGQGRVALVTGGPGRGKTALLTEFARRAMEANANLLVASGGCNAYSGVGDPYLPFREVMGMLGGDVEPRWLSGQITTQHAQRLWAAVPLLTQALLARGPDVLAVFVEGEGLLARAAMVGGTDTPWLSALRAAIERRQALPLGAAAKGVEQSHLFEQYTNVLRKVGESHPLLLILDDLQWADSASIGLLFHLGRRLPGMPVLLACTYRPEEVALGRDGERHPLLKVLAEFRRMYGEVRVDLGRDDKAEGRRFVDALLDSEPNELGEHFRKALFWHTGGHPLFTIELLRAMQERGDLVPEESGRWVEGAALDWDTLPARVEAVIEERIARLEEGLREILTVASVEGEEFTAQVVGRVQKLGERQILRSLSQELEKRHRLVREQGELTVEHQRLSRYCFAHALVQRHVYNNLSEGERRVLHREIATVLEQLYEANPEEIAVHLVQHFQSSGDPDREAYYARLAGELAATRYANAEALRYLGRALALTPEADHSTRFDLLQARERVYSLQGKRDAQAGDLAVMTELGQVLEDAERQARAMLGQADYGNLMGDYLSASKAAQETIDLAQEAGHSGLEAAGYRQWGRALWRMGDLGQARARLESAVRLARSASLPWVEAQSLGDLGVVADYQGDFEAAMEYHQQSLRLCHEIGHRPGEATALGNLGVIAARQGDCAASKVRFEESLRICCDIGDRRGEAIALNNLAAVAQLSGDYADVRAYCEQSLQIKREVGDRGGESTTLINLGIVSCSVGDFAGSKAHLERALRLCREIGSRIHECASLSGLCLLHHQLGDDRAAQAYAGEALRVAQQLGERSRQAEALCNLGHAETGLGRLPEAAEAYGQALALRRELKQTNHAMEAMAGLARVALVRGDSAEALVYGEQILSHLETGSLEGTDEPFRIYLTCYRVLRANCDPRAEDVLQTAYEELQRHATNISDEGLRRSYLENVPANQQIVRERGQLDR